MHSIQTLTTALSPNPGAPATSGSPSKPHSLEQLNQTVFSTGNLTASHFERFWTRMTEAFGHKWTSNYGLKPNQAWMDGLADMTVDEIKTGLVNLKGWTDDEGWPPSLPQFRELCRPHAAPAHAAYVALPQPKTPWEQRQSSAATAFSALREGALKPVMTQRRCGLSDVDRANLERLDWERIRAASAGDFAALAERPMPEPVAGDFAALAEGCTCKLERKAANEWRTVGRACDYCRAWDKKLAELGITGSPVIQPFKPAARRSRRRAA